MTTPGTVAPYSQGAVTQPVTPSAMSSGMESAVYGLGQVLINLIKRSVGPYHSENEMDSAVTAVENWVKQSVSRGGMMALLTGEEHASKEDVTKRQPPPGMPSVQPAYAAGLDYDKLAAAIVRVQQQNAQDEGAIEGTVVP